MPYKDPIKKKEFDKAYKLANKEKYALIQKNYRENNKLKVAESKKAAYAKNKEHYLNYGKAHYAENKEALKLAMKVYSVTNKPRRNAYNAKSSADLKDFYVKAVLRKQGFSNDQITPELIELKRVTLKTERLCRQLKNS